MITPPDQPDWQASLAPNEAVLWQGKSAPMRPTLLGFLGLWLLLATALMLSAGVAWASVLGFAAFITAAGVGSHLHTQDIYVLTSQRAMAWRRGLLRQAAFEELSLAGMAASSVRGHVTLHKRIGGRIKFFHLPRADRRWLLREVPRLAGPRDVL